MTIATTPTYGIAYCDSATELGQFPAVTEQAAETIEAALIRGGVAPANAADVIAVSNRVNTLEAAKVTDETAIASNGNRLTALEALRPGKRLWKPTATPTQLVGTTWALLTWESRETNAQLPAGTGLFAAANPGRLTATKAGRYRSTATLASNITGPAARQLQLRAQPSGTAAPTAATGQMLGATIAQAQSGLAVQQVLADEFVLAVGDFVECYAFSSVASTPFGTSNGYDAFFTLTFIGAAA